MEGACTTATLDHLMCSAEAGSYLVALLPIPLSEVREAAATHLEAHGASLSAPAAWLLGLGSCIRQQLNWQASTPAGIHMII
jgi:hypothetical protein